MLRWESTEGGDRADFHVIIMVGGDGNPAWQMFVPGDVYEAPLPDFSMVPGLEDISSGTIFWAIFSIKVPGFVFDEFRYSYLNDRYWSHAAVNQFFSTL
jgi:hypothetical protein